MPGFNLKNLGTDHKKLFKKLSPVTLGLIFLSIITILIFIFFILIPGQKAIKTIREDVQSVKNDIKVINEKFVPAYAIAKKYKEIQFEPKFSIPKRDSLSRENLTELPNKFHELALEHHLKLSNKNLDLGFMKTKSKSISMFLELEGKLYDFRNYLIMIVSLPFFDSFEKIKINSTHSNLKKFSVDLKINIK